MDNITLIVGAILSIIGATGALVRWLTPKGRLRADVMSGLELLKAEPPSSAKPELEQHITYQTRLLIAFEEPFNAAERERRHNGFGLVAGAGIPIGLATLELTEESPSIPQVVIGWIIGGVFYVWGFVLVASTGTSRWKRRMIKLRAVDRTIADEADTRELK